MLRAPNVRSMAQIATKSLFLQGKSFTLWKIFVSQSVQKVDPTNQRDLSPLMIAIVAIGVGLFVGGTACFADGSDDEGGERPEAASCSHRAPDAPSIPLPTIRVLRPYLGKELNITRAEGLIENLRYAVGQAVWRLTEESTDPYQDLLSTLNTPQPGTLVALWTFLLKGERATDFEASDLLKNTYPEAYVSALTNDGIASEDACLYLCQETADYTYRWARNHPHTGVGKLVNAAPAREQLARAVFSSVKDAYVGAVPFFSFDCNPQLACWPDTYCFGGHP